MKENRIEMNADLVINPADYDRNEAIFSVVFPDDKFVSFISSLDSGSSDLNLRFETQYGEYKKSSYEKKYK